ncbi:MAG: protein kinase domain-containing protein [Acidobacteriota bacterium]
MASDPPTENVWSDEVQFGEDVLAPGSLVAGRYEIRRHLGSGGFAVVYLAHDLELRRDVALKILRSERMGRSALTRLRREAAIAREISSPRLLRIFDIGSDGRSVFLTMEFVEGESLRERLQRGPLPAAEGARLAEQALAGLAALHAAKIVHRDIKPANLLITRDGEMKLADFGLALQSESEETRATIGDAVVGTLDYLAPEQALGHEATPQSDLYSLGVTLYEAFTGERPYRGASPLGVLLGHVHRQPEDVRKLRKDISASLATVIAGLLEKDPARRYPSAEAALADLQAHSLLGSRRRRARLLRGVALAALIAALGGAAVAWRIAARPRFAHLVAGVPRGVRGVDGSGATLWEQRWADWPLGVVRARLRPGEPERIVTVIRPDGVSHLDVTRNLSVLDEETGKVVETVRLPDAGGSFPGYADEYAPSLYAIDLDGDGYDEILASYHHEPYWPSYTVLYEPRVGRTRWLLIAGGHHRVVGAQDLDGDGRPEVILAGINNRMGWYSALAALRIRPWINVVQAGQEDDNPARTPDFDPLGTSDTLLWYTLAPRGFFDGAEPVRIDARRRRFILRYQDGSQAEVGFDGFLAGTSSLLPERERLAARDKAYALLRDGTRATADGAGALAVTYCDQALAALAPAGDPILTEWIERARGKALVAAGQIGEAEAQFERLMRGSPADSDVAFDAGRSLHLHGDLERAIAWYRRGYGRGGSMTAGRIKYEFLEGTVLALGELGRWAEARAEAQRFAAIYPSLLSDSRSYEEYVRWREGQVPEIAGLAETPDLQGYWRLEFRWRRGEEAATLLPLVEGKLRTASETLALLHSLHAELLARLGRGGEALAEARDALERLRADLPLSTIARAHYDLVTERFARLAKAAGRQAEAQTALAALHRFRNDKIAVSR